MKRISVTGYVPANEEENEILTGCWLIEKHIRKDIRAYVLTPKAQAKKAHRSEVKRVRVVVTVDVEAL